MKKTLLLVSVLMVSAMGLSQESNSNHPDKSNAKHELRLDALEGLVVPAFDLSYEYIINQFSGLGVTVWASLDGNIEDYQNFAITPFYRQYFFNKKDYGARGFYAEGLLQFALGEEDEVFIEGELQPNTTENWAKFGIGFALGQKWVSRNGFSLDLNIGAGRYFGSNENGPEAFVRGGIGVGYRF